MAGDADGVCGRACSDAGTYGERSARRQQQHQTACERGVRAAIFCGRLCVKPASSRQMQLVIEAHHGAC